MISAWEKPEVAGSQNWAVGVLIDLGDVMCYQKSLHEIATEWAGALFDESDLLARSL